MVRKPHHHRFLDEERVREAIINVEQSTDAPICVSVAPHFWGSIRRTAQRALKRQGLTRLPQRNAVLFFVVPSRREFVILGDAGAHQVLGQETWDAIAAGVQERFHAGNPTSGVIHGIEEVGRHLAQHFPRKKTSDA